METYTFFPPQMRATQLSYHVLQEGTDVCKHDLLDNDWRDRISVAEGLVFITFTCRDCGRQVSQSLEQVLPPEDWNGRIAHGHSQ